MFETSAAGTRLSTRLFVAAMRDLGWIAWDERAQTGAEAEAERPLRAPAALADAS